MTRVYANEEVAVFEDAEIVEAIGELSLLCTIMPDLFLETNRLLNQMFREVLDTEMVLGIIVIDQERVGVLQYNVVADEDVFYEQGRDEIGFYIEV